MSARGELPVITLCGSMRFREEFARLDAELSLAGHVVLTPVTLDPAADPTADERELLSRIHLQKIAMSDQIFIVNVGGYFGESTRRELNHARSLGVAVRFLEPPDEDR